MISPVIKGKGLRPTIRTAILWTFRLVGSAVTLYFVFLAVPGGGGAFTSGLQMSSTGFLALLIYGPTLVGIEGTRYWLEARRQGIPGISCLDWYSAFLRSRPWAYLLPISVAGEAAILLRGKQLSWNIRSAIRTLISVRLLGLFLWAFWCGAASSQAAIFPLVNHLPTPIATGEFWIGLGGIGLSGFVIYEWANRRPFPMTSIILTLASTILVAMTTKVAATATGVSFGWLDIMGFLALLNFALVLPVSLGGIGVQEGILLAMGTNKGIPAESLLAFSLLLHLQRMVVAAIGSLLIFTEPTRDSQDNQ